MPQGEPEAAAGASRRLPVGRRRLRAALDLADRLQPVAQVVDGLAFLLGEVAEVDVVEQHLKPVADAAEVATVATDLVENALLDIGAGGWPRSMLISPNGAPGWLKVQGLDACHSRCGARLS